MARASFRALTPERRARALVFARYCVLQIPDLVVVGGVLFALTRWTQLSEREATLLFGLWLLKDLALYPVLRIAYEKAGTGGAQALVGALGTAQDPLDPDGWVRIGAELWRARLVPGDATTPPPSVPAGEVVRVVAVRGLTLEVTRCEAG